MRYPVRLTSTLALVLAALFALGAVPGLAQSSEDPPADPLAGVTIEMLSSGAPDQLNGNMLMLMRMTMEPGSSIPAHRHPGPVALTVLSGTFGTEIVDGAGELTRAPADGTPTAPETADVNELYTLAPGDSLFYQNTAHTMVNVGDEPLVLLISAIFDPEQPGFIFLDGTPTP